ncbi:lytic transglycosylase domain-containing protein [Desulfovermiculus halophilus]|jgi:membrane-bound lytic murein transglycosylase D|uniref:lytic transglycosylase domain-containing protein n=1 Tax=Desulfovermiculus halophilus TaxID=339722 RepID=UPI000684A678|nr:lytic transglycosylase domain-containing protein [Desulfovermiculus halophilus]
MRCILCCCLFAVFLAGCAHVGPGESGPETADQASTSHQDKSRSEADQTDSRSQGAHLNIPAPGPDLGQPLDQEVTGSPQVKAEEKELTPEQRKALHSEAEITFELDIRETDILHDYFVYYSKTKHHVFQRWLKRAEHYLPYIRKVFTERGLPQDLVFLPFAESGFDPLAYSHAGAAGMWQFMPATGRMFGLKANWWVDERRDPYKATVAAAKYLKQLYKRFGDWYLVLAAYNAGGGHVSQAMRRSGASDYFDLASSKALHNETCRYVPKFLAVLKIVRNLETLDFEPLNWDAPAQPASIQVQPGTDLVALAEAVGLSWKKFRTYNPRFLRSAAPPNGKARVYLPQTKIATAKQFLNSTRHTASKGVHRYRIRPGDSWWKLSKRFDVPLSALKDFNQTSSNTLQPGQWVLVPGQEQPAGTGSYSGSGSTYIVRSGDTLWSIARSMDISVQSLRRTNPKLNAQHLSVGQKIQLPGRAGTRRIATKRANYSVKSGDTLWGIARKFELSLSTLVQANGLTKQDPLKVGTKLYIPDITHAQQVTTQRTARQARVDYQVQKGDNVWSIARKFGVSPDKIMDWNKLSSRDIIHPGDTLTIYTR